MSSRRSPGMGVPANNRLSPRITSPIAGSTMNSRASPIGTGGTPSGNRMSPGMGGQSYAPTNSQSPLQPSRQSPLVTRHSPMDNIARSPMTNTCESPTSRINHIIATNNHELSRNSSLSENNIPNALSHKTLESARSLNSLGAPHMRPLISERYEMLSDDDN